MYQNIITYAEELDQKSRARRRDFHKYPETAWLEMRTSASIAKTLTELGYEVLTGRCVCLESARHGLPSEEALKKHAATALAQGAPEAYLTEEMKEGMDAQARRICQAAADMTGCTVELVPQGSAESQQSDEDFLKQIGDMVREHLPHLKVSSCENAQNWGSEDISLMMNRVQAHGGKATYMRSMTDMASAQHTTAFDFDERVLVDGIETFAVIAYSLLKEPVSI